MKIFKKTYYLLLCFVMLLIIILTGCNNSINKKMNSSLESIKSKGQLVIGLDDSFPPMGFKDKNGKLVGFDIDLCTEICKKLNVSPVFKSVEWDGSVLSLKNKDIDIIWNGLTITKERQKQIAFSNPYIENKQIIITNKKSNIKNKKDLDNKTIGIQLGSSVDCALSNNTKFLNSIKDIKKYSTNTEALMDLKNKRIQAVVIDEVVGNYYSKKKPGCFEILTDNFGKEYYGIGFRKEDTELKNKINELLDELKKDGTYNKIYEKWFSK